MKQLHLYHNTLNLYEYVITNHQDLPSNYHYIRTGTLEELRDAVSSIVKIPDEPPLKLVSHE